MFKNDVKYAGASSQACMYLSRCVPDAPLPVWCHLASFCAYFCHFRHKKIQRISKNDVKRSGASTQTCMYQSRCVPDAPLPVWRHLASFCAYFCHFRHKKIQRIFKNDVKRSGASTRTCMYQSRCVPMRHFRFSAI
jgi:plasmid maintenance system killer protein